MIAERHNTELMNSDRVARASQRSAASLVVLDTRCEVLLVTAEALTRTCDALLNELGHLRAEFRDVASELIARCERLSEPYAIAFIDDYRFARVVALDGHAGRNYVFTIEQYRQRDSLARAALRFSLTKRETQVLAFILEGASASEVAAALYIAEATVQGYYKRLLQKTRSRNRPSMVATVCDWEGARASREG
jgi:DNA-binding CsgD family transcriptional regulator